MYRNILIPALALLLTTTACSSSLGDLGKDISVDTAALTNSGAWQVTKFVEEMKNETSDYSGFEFYFDDNGVFRAVAPGGTTTTGTWARTVDDGLPRLVITIAGTEDLEEISDDWVLDSLSDTKIELSDDNLTSMESLHFERL